MASRDRHVSPFHPAFWPLWTGVWIFRLLCRLPWPVQLRLGKSAGRFFFHAVRFRRDVVATNLKLCFPDLSTAERRALGIRHFEAMGIGMFETGVAWWAEEQRLPHFEIHGREHLENAAAAKKGVILLTAHFTTLELGGRMLAARFTLGGLFRRPDHPVIARLMQHGRIDTLTPAIPMNDLRGLIRALKQGHTIWYAPDQGRRSKFSAILPFFGVPALTNTATGRLAAMTGAAVVPFVGVRRPDGSYLLTLLPALDTFPSNDPNEDALRVNRQIENFILQAPEQYFWVHRRFKRRGAGFPNVYQR